MATKLIGPRQAGALLGLSVVQVRRLFRAGRITGQVLQSPSGDRDRILLDHATVLALAKARDAITERGLRVRKRARTEP